MYSLPENKDKTNPEIRIFRTDKSQGNFVQVAKELAETPNLTAEAKGIMLYLLSKPDDWKPNVKDIYKHMKNGRDSIYRILKELEINGFIVWEKAGIDKTGKNARESKIYVYEKPIKPVDIQLPGNQETGNQETDYQETENQYLTNNDLTNNDLTNNENTNSPPTPQEENPKNGAIDLSDFIKNNFSEETQEILTSVKGLVEIVMRDSHEKHFTIDFLQAFKQAEQETKNLNIKPSQVKNELVKLLADMEAGTEIKDLTKLMIYRLKNPRKENRSAQQEKSRQKKRTSPPSNVEYIFSRQEAPEEPSKKENKKDEGKTELKQGKPETGEKDGETLWNEFKENISSRSKYDYFMSLTAKDKEILWEKLDKFDRDNIHYEHRQKQRQKNSF